MAQYLHDLLVVTLTLIWLENGGQKCPNPLTFLPHPLISHGVTAKTKVISEKSVLFVNQYNFFLKLKYIRFIIIYPKKQLFRQIWTEIMENRDFSENR